MNEKRLRRGSRVVGVQRSRNESRLGEEIRRRCTKSSSEGRAAGDRSASQRSCSKRSDTGRGVDPVSSGELRGVSMSSDSMSIGGGSSILGFTKRVTDRSGSGRFSNGTDAMSVGDGVRSFTRSITNDECDGIKVGHSGGIVPVDEEEMDDEGEGAFFSTGDSDGESDEEEEGSRCCGGGLE